MKTNRYKEAYKRLGEGLRPVCLKYGKNKYFFFIDAFLSLVRYGITPNEYMAFHFYELSTIERKQFYTARHSAKYEKLLNDRKYYDTFWQKEKTNLAFKEFIKRDWLFVPKATNDEIKGFLHRHDKIIVKPTNMSSGHGIYVYKGQSIEEIKVGKCLLEQFVCQHPAMTAINPTSVNTVRVYTMLKKSPPRMLNDVIFLSVSIRAGGGNAEVDNYHAGGVGYPVDVDSGVVMGAGTDILGNKYLYHPSTGHKMIGFEIPNYEAMKVYIENLCHVIPTARLIAWDIAVTEDDFELIEANYEGDPGFMQAPSKQGKLKIIKENI